MWLHLSPSSSPYSLPWLSLMAGLENEAILSLWQMTGWQVAECYDEPHVVRRCSCCWKEIHAWWGDRSPRCIYVTWTHPRWKNSKTKCTLFLSSNVWNLVLPIGAMILNCANASCSQSAFAPDTHGRNPLLPETLEDHEVEQGLHILTYVWL